MQSPRETADILFASSNLNPLNILSTADSLRHHCKLGLLRLRRSSASIPGTNVHRRPKSKDGVGGSSTGARSPRAAPTSKLSKRPQMPSDFAIH